MCVVIDINSFPAVFDIYAEDHLEFKPILDWIRKGRGKLVYGGTQYKLEMKRIGRYIGVIKELKIARRVVELDDQLVDQEQKRIKSLIIDNDFDDPHIIAIISVSGCLIICSKDKRSYKYIRNRSLYKNRYQKKPKIYTGISNINLLSNKNIPKRYR